MIDPKHAAFFVPPGLRKFKLKLFNEVGAKIEAAGGAVVRDDPKGFDNLPDDMFPIVGCTPFLRPWITKWIAEGTPWCMWDRGYLRRVFATHLPTGAQLGVPGGYYRWTMNAFQMTRVRDVPDDRWKALKLDDQVKPWRKGGRRIVIAHTGADYWNVRGLPEDWSFRIAEQLKQWTDRPIFVRDKESKLALADELADAHCLVTHGSIAAVEAVVMGCPVFVDPESAAALVGLTDLSQIERPVYPERMPWLHSLAYCQFSEQELVDGTLWALIE